MKKAYLIAMFDKKTRAYLGTLNDVFQTNELARDYLDLQVESSQVRFVIIAVPFHCHK